MVYEFVLTKIIHLREEGSTIVIFYNLVKSVM